MTRNAGSEGSMFRSPRVGGSIGVWMCRGNGCAWAMLPSSSAHTLLRRKEYIRPYSHSLLFEQNTKAIYDLRHYDIRPTCSTCPSLSLINIYTPRPRTASFFSFLIVTILSAYTQYIGRRYSFIVGVWPVGKASILHYPCL